MERFAIKIDRKLKANLYKICRLCGMDYPDMVPILSDDKPENAKDDEGVDVDAEPEMSQKINVLIGLLITKDDRMPQTMCTLCVDKVNDFYEFREMCYATYEQTRKLLGLKNVVKKPVVEPKPKLEVKEEIPVVPPPASNKLLNRKRKAEIETAPAVVVAPPVVSNKKLRLAATPLKEAATKKAKLKAKEWKEAKEEEKEAVVKDECREVITRNMKLMKEKEAKEAKEAKITKDAVKEETTNTAVKEESNEKATTTSKKDHKEKYSKKEHKDNIKESAFALKKDNKEVICTKKGKHKAKEAKEEDVTAVKDEIKEEVKEEPMTAQTSTANSSNTAIANPTAKLKHGCSICSERFGTKGKLEAHVRLHHIPKVERYVCTACNETISKSFDIKNHQLWHKLSKTPYVCGLCGESIVSTYAYARHLHEHGFETPPAYMVLDRECPQCHITFTTNFLYNTHPCAVRTRRCAGCNRLQRSEIEYVKHSALCAKAYLNYSKHIAPAVEAQEDEVRIKNENDVEAAAEEMARISGLPLEMSPVVQLTRLSSPLLMAANHCLPIPNIEDIPTTSGSKKSGKKGVSKKELKRVDELLKSTLDVLVSIKHEPEVHVDSETAPGAAEASDDEAIGDDGFQNDFHHNEESDDENENAAAGDAGNRIQIKQEIDDSKDTAHATAESSENGASKTSCGFGLKLKIRKEHGQLNSSIIEQEAVDKKSEKRKKKKKHKDKEKDKQKSQKDHAEEQNSRDSFKAQNHVGESDGVAAVKETPSTTVHIKTEPVDSMETDEAPSAINSMTHRPQPEATIMTSIPMMQLQISCISEGVEFNAANVSGAGNVEQPTPQHQQPHNMSEQEDVKPNREELDRMLNISHMPPSVNEVMPPPATKLQIANVTGGIAMETDETKEEVENETTMEQDHTDATDDEHHEEEENEPDNQLHKKLHIKQQQKIMSPSEKLSKTKLTLKITSPKTSTPNKSRNKACKSTAKPSNPPVALQIAAVQSGVTLPPSTAASEPMEQNDFVPMFIKPEPQHRGYADEEPAAMSPERTPSPTPSSVSSPAREVPEGVNTSSQHFTPEEQAYISTIDFDNITIKQEKDLEINDVQMKPKKPLRPRNHSLNGIKKRKVIKEHSVAENHNEDAEEKECEASSEMENDEEHEEHESEAEEADEEADEEEEEEEEEVDEEDDEEEDVDEDAEDEEEREYRELEYPPELAETATPDDGEETELSDNENNTDNERPSNIDEDDEDLDADENSQRSSDPKESPLQDESNKDDQYKKEGGEANDNKTPSAFVIANICSNVAEAATGIGVILDRPVVNIKQEITEFEEPPQETAPVLKIASVASGSLDLGNILPIESGLAATLHQNSLAVEPQCHMEMDQNMTEIHRPNQSLTENNMEDNSMVQMGTLNENVNIDAPPQEVRITHERHVQENTTNQYSNQTASDITTSQFLPQLENPMEVPTNSIEVGVSNNNPYIPRLLEDTAVAINASNLNYPTYENPNTEVNGIASEMGGLVGESPVAAIPIPNQNENQILSHLANDESAVRKPLLPQGKFEDGTITGIVHQSDDLKLEAIPVNVTREQCNPSSSSSSVALNQMGSPTAGDEYDETNAADGETDMDDEMQLEDNSNLANLEEQQNQQNLEQQLSSSSSQFAATGTRPTALALHPYLEDISSSSNSFLSNALSQTPPPTLQTSSNCSLSAMETVATTTATMPPVSQNLNITHQQNNEETENILNESNDMLNRRCGAGFAASSSTHHTAAFNFDNINEIAENNNNANIEREQLQDDQQQQRRHQQQHQGMDDVT
ncbi:zinc finger E-box-binding homeobox 1 isoform X1 [Musca domestica]|uniref:Zinc finger E-box-binding homeobox 1 isoform X1 n=1 Tax=Musca domestica TaxID=7370 RepID=A0A9J7D0W0_MUSDO|nr:zinc finger E-box-binding homeobox 1 isoform X1 [Musca domestica]